MAIPAAVPVTAPVAAPQTVLKAVPVAVPVTPLPVAVPVAAPLTVLMAAPGPVPVAVVRDVRPGPSPQAPPTWTLSTLPKGTRCAPASAVQEAQGSRQEKQRNEADYTSLVLFLCLPLNALAFYLSCQLTSKHKAQELLLRAEEVQTLCC